VHRRAAAPSGSRIHPNGFGGLKPVFADRIEKTMLPAPLPGFAASLPLPIHLPARSILNPNLAAGPRSAFEFDLALCAEFEKRQLTTTAVIADGSLHI